MADSPQFQAVIAAVDKFTPAMEELARRLETTGGLLERMPRINTEAMRGMAELQRQMGAVHEDAPRMFGRFQQAAGGATEAVRTLHGHVRHLWGTMTEMVPLLAGLGTVGAVGGMFEMVEATGEAREKLVETARALDMTTGALSKYNFLAKMAGQTTDDVQAGFGKLAVNVGKAASGKDKDLAGLLNSIHLKFHDKKGALSLDAILPQLRQFVMNNQDNPNLPVAMQALFGKGWQAATKVLELPKEEWEQFNKDWEKIKLAPTKEQIQSLTEYHHAWTEMGIAVKSVGTSISFALAPALTPLLTHAKDFLLTHRDDISKWVGKEALAIGQGLEQITPQQWDKAFSAVGGAFDAIRDALLLLPAALGKIGAFFDDFRSSRLGSFLGFHAPAAPPAAPPAPPSPQPSILSDPAGWWNYHRGLSRYGMGETSTVPTYTPPPGMQPFTTGIFPPRIPKHALLPSGFGGLQVPMALAGGGASEGSGWAARPELGGDNMPDWARPMDGPAKPSFDISQLYPQQRTTPETIRSLDGHVEMTLDIRGAPAGSTFDSRSTGIASPVRVDLGRAFDHDPMR